ncbi:MAG: hypothetical protein Q9165_008230 [Trypethelium subeluteriae]
MITQPPSPIKRLLVVNRGEIAVRILQAARELLHPVETYAVYTVDDETHVHLGNPHHALLLPSSASYMDIPLLVSIATEHMIDAVHPGYGFLSESSELVREMWEKAKIKVVGPGYEVLEKTGDKLQARQLAKACKVPVLPGTHIPKDSSEEISRFTAKVGYPVMIKAIDGGGGRGIRLVETETELQKAVSQTIGESLSGKIFVEKAARGGFHHVEVQIIGDGTGQVRHLWERDCSVQRRYQKIVECSPSLVRDRSLVAELIEAAVKIGAAIRYSSLGTFEFLVNENTRQFYFLEINPRIQVEHTITEQITSLDLVRMQLLLFQGLTLQDVGLACTADARNAPSLVSIQMRLCAEEPENKFLPSVGKIKQIRLPSGNGIRVDTHCSQTLSTSVGPDFDNLLAKIIVTGADWDETIRKAGRALQDTKVEGVKTNLELLQGIIGSQAFYEQRVDNVWLESEVDSLLETGREIREARKPALEAPAFSGSSHTIARSSHVLFQKGEAWSIDLSPIDRQASHEQSSHHLLLQKILRNEFPNSIAAEIAYTIPGSTGPHTTHYRIKATSTPNSAASISSNHRRGDPNNERHILSPMSGKLIEVLVDAGDEIEKGQVIAFVRQMKMELEVRSPKRGRIRWAFQFEDQAGEEIAEGVLLAELEYVSSKEKGATLLGKL